MKKAVAVFIYMLAFSASSQKNAVYYEFLGNGGFSSINYERQLTDVPKITARLGVGLNIAHYGLPTSNITVPLSLHYLHNIKNSNFLEASLGITWMEVNRESINSPVNHWQLFTTIGFRRHFGNSSVWRFHIAPFTAPISKNKVGNRNNGLVFSQFEFPRAWIGFSIGKRF